MSEIHNSQQTPTDAIPTDEGAQQQVAEAVDNLTQEEIDLLPVDEVGDKYVSVTVNGEELKVPLREALAGYQRQADYTRKTQEISEQRRQIQFASAIQEALQNDPKGTLELLSRHYGIAQEAEQDDPLLDDPQAKQFRELEQRVRSFEEQKAYEQLERTIQTLQNRYGDDFNSEEVVAKALALGSSDLEAVYKQMSFDKVWQEAQAVREARTKRQASEQQTVAAKRTAAVADNGGSAASANVSAAPITSLRDAYEAAKRQMGV
jgi:hypothetical protein